MPFSISLYDTASRSVRPFTPLTDKQVKIYSCGPTVYGVQHLGNMRYVFYVDLLKTVLKELGWYTVTHVMNITDVGHLTDDGDAGQDKMEKGAAREWLSVWDIAKRYTDKFLQDITILDANHFDTMPAATQHIKQQIIMVKAMIQQGLTYEIPGDGIYCDTSRVRDYGKLLPKAHLEGLQQGARVDTEGKRNPTDFALWKFSPTDEKRAMERIFSNDQWREGVLISADIESTLNQDEQNTRGFPWRHIECSAMCFEYLWEQIDIHTGGIEHIPVHHTNEITQSEHTFCKSPRVQFRFHLQHLQIDGAKISKSIGNVVYLDEIIEKWFTPQDVRCFFLNAHYRSFQDFTRQNLTSSKNMRHNLIKKIAAVDLTWFEGHQPWPTYAQLAERMADDLDTVWTLQQLCGFIGSEKEVIYDILLFDMQILRIGLLEWTRKLQTAQRDIPETLHQLAQQRLDAKAQKDRALADQLRREIEAQGWTVRDTAEGYALIRSEWM